MYFVEGARHNITLGVSGYFKSNGVEISKTTEIFERVIELAGGDKNDIIRVINDTYTTKKSVADLSFAPRQKDQILIYASFGAPLTDTFYIVKKVMPDGHGGCRLLLNVAPKPCDITSENGAQDQ